MTAFFAKLIRRSIDHLGGVLRRMALNMLKRETTSQGGVAAKRKRAGWDEDYLLLVLAQ